VVTNPAGSVTSAARGGDREGRKDDVDLAEGALIEMK
jgi:hypothetical protein